MEFLDFGNGLMLLVLKIIFEYDYKKKFGKFICM